MTHCRHCRHCEQRPDLSYWCRAFAKPCVIACKWIEREPGIDDV